MIRTVAAPIQVQHKIDVLSLEFGCSLQRSQCIVDNTKILNLCVRQKSSQCLQPLEVLSVVTVHTHIPTVFDVLQQQPFPIVIVLKHLTIQRFKFVFERCHKFVLYQWGNITIAIRIICVQQFNVLNHVGSHSVARDGMRHGMVQFDIGLNHFRFRVTQTLVQRIATKFAHLGEGRTKLFGKLQNIGIRTKRFHQIRMFLLVAIKQ
mmetsp:Transcript_21103/g.33864  ORF Transcript_21103/g.33864 Transcript_21103/m.33864 type:complete len:206 (+) Transcript_21103:468-1085(+)